MSLQTNTASLTALLESVNALPDKIDTSGTATAADIYTGKTATVNDVKLTGTNPYNAANVDPAVTSALAAIAEKGVDTSGKGLADIATLVAGITGGSLVKVGNIVSGYTQNTLDIKSAYPKYADLTVDDFYLVPATFDITQDGTITGGTYNLNKTYDASTGVLTAWRDSVPGQVGLNFSMIVYVLDTSVEAGGGGGLAATCGVHVSATDDEEITIEHGLSKRPALILWFAYPTGETPAVFGHRYVAVQSYLFGGYAFGKSSSSATNTYFAPMGVTAEKTQTKWDGKSGFSSDLFYNVNENTFSTKMPTIAGISNVWIAFENDLAGVTI